MKRVICQTAFILSIFTALVWGGVPEDPATEQVDLYRVPNQQAMKLEGVVVERSDQKLLVRRGDGSKVLVSWDDATEIKEKKSNFFRGAKSYSADDLLLGLNLIVEGRGDASGRLAAQQIKFTQDDLETARSIASSLVPVERQLDAANRQITQVEKRLQESETRADLLTGEIEDMGEGLRKTKEDLSETRHSVDQALSGVEKANHRITALDDYEVTRSLTVHFKASSYALSEEAVASLKEFADSVQAESGYLVEVSGHASSDGNAEYNRRLSERRADSVRTFLAEEGGISLRRFISPHGFGESQPVADDETRDGRRQNRRVEIRLLVNRGLIQKSQMVASTGSN